MESFLSSLTPGEIVLLIIGLLMAAANAINVLGNAAEKIAKARKAAKAPNERQDDRLDVLEAWKKEMQAANLPARVQQLESGKAETDRKLAADKKELTEIRNGMYASHLAQFALLDHALNGNNISQMQEAKTELQKYLAHK